MTGDEEDSGEPQSLARAALVEAAKGADYALGFEDGPGDPRYAVTARRGTSSWTLRGQGTSGALVADLPLRRRLRRDLRGGADPRRLPPEARGRGAPDVQPRRDARRHVDRVRCRPEPRARRSARRTSCAERAWSRAIFATLSKEQLDRGATGDAGGRRGRRCRTREATLTFDDGYPPLAPTDGNARLLAVYDQRQPGSRVRAGRRRQPGSGRRRRRVVRRRRGAEHHRRHRPDGPRRSHGRRNRRPRDAAEPDQAGGDHALPAAQQKRRVRAQGPARTEPSAEPHGSLE